VSRPVNRSYAKTHNNVVSKANMGDTNLAAKLNGFMENMIAKKNALEGQMTKLSIVITESLSRGELRRNKQ